MADTKISDLAAATTVGATDLLAVVQGGTNKKLSGITIAAGSSLAGANTGDGATTAQGTKADNAVPASKAIIHTATGTAVAYATPALALVDFASGDEIEIEGAFTLTAVFAKNGLRVKLGANAVLTWSSSTVGIFDDGGAAMTMRVYGPGKLAFTNSGSSIRGCVHSSHASSDIIVDVGEIELTAGSSGLTAANFCAAGKSEVTAKRITGIGNGGTTAGWWTGGRGFVEADFGVNLGYGHWSEVTTSTTGDWTAVLKHVSLNSTGGAGAYDTGSHASSVIWDIGVHLDGTGANSDVVSAIGAGRFYVDRQKVTGAITVNSGLFYLKNNCKIASNQNRAFDGSAIMFNNSGGTAELSLGHLDPGTYYGQCFSINGGTTFAWDGRLTTAGAAEVSTILVVTIPSAGDFITIARGGNELVDFYAVVDSSGSAPGLGHVEIPFTVTTGDTESQIAAALAVAMNGNGWTASASTATVTATDSKNGNRTDLTSSVLGVLTPNLTVQGRSSEFLNVTAGTIILYGITIDATASEFSAVRGTGGTVYLFNCEIKGSAGVYDIDASGGVAVNVTNCRGSGTNGALRVSGTVAFTSTTVGDGGLKFSGTGIADTKATMSIIDFDPASPGAIGGTTPGTGSFTSLTTNGGISMQSAITSAQFLLDSTGFTTGLNNRVGWTSTDANGTRDTGLGRNAAGVVEVNNGTAGTLRDLKLRSVIATGVVRLKGYTVATLPAGTQGDTAFVTDALAPTFLATIVGGGAVVTPVFYNGTNWVGS